MRWPIVLALLLAACQPPRAVEPAQALSRCEAAALPAMRASVPGARAVVLGPVSATSVETRSAGTIRTVLRGGGRVDGGSVAGDTRFVCLIDGAGEVMFVDVAPVDAAIANDGCGGDRACLRDHLAETEQALAQAEATVIGEAGGSVDDPMAASIGAWRVYRDAECRRRVQGDACRIAVTRARILELRLR